MKPITGLKVDGVGEGSRGGKIIGHTTGGKPIYGNHNHPGHKGFSAEDHFKAHDLHVKQVEELLDQASKVGGTTHKVIKKRDKLHKQAQHHLHQSNLHRNAADKMDSK